MPSQNEAAYLVWDYSNRKALSKLGYQKPFDQLTCFEVEYLTLIASEFSKLEQRELKANSRKKR